MFKHRVVVSAPNALSEESGGHRHVCLVLAQIDTLALLFHGLLILDMLIKYYVGVDALVGAWHPHLGKLLSIVYTVDLRLSHKPIFRGLVLSRPRWVLFRRIQTSTLIYRESCLSWLLLLLWDELLLGDCCAI